MKGKQIALTLYLPPKKYWLLKAISRDNGYSMQLLLRQALDDVLAEAARRWSQDLRSGGADRR